MSSNINISSWFLNHLVLQSATFIYYYVDIMPQPTTTPAIQCLFSQSSPDIVIFHKKIQTKTGGQHDCVLCQTVFKQI